MTRYKGKSGPSPVWERLEQQELDVRYKDAKVSYHRLSVDGRTDKMDQRVKKGYLIPGGEFAAMNKPFYPRAPPSLLWIIAKPPAARTCASELPSPD